MKTTTQNRAIRGSRSVRFAIGILTFILLSFTINQHVQAQNLDSLYNVWQNQSQANADRAEAFKSYIWKGYLFSQPDSAYVLAESLIAFGGNNNYPNASAVGLNLQGVSWYVRGEYSKAQEYYTRSLKVYEEIGDQSGVAASLNNIGLVAKNQGNNSKALSYYTRSLKIHEQTGNQEDMANSINNIGIIYRDQGDFPKALDQYIRSLKLREQIGDQNGVASSLANIGLIYSSQADYPKALDYFSRSLEIFEKTGDQKNIATDLNNIGTVYKDLKDFPKALDYFTRSLIIHEQSGNPLGIASSLANSGSIYSIQGDYQKALENYTRCLNIFEQMGDQQRIAGTLVNIGRIKQDQGEYPKALEYCQKGYDLAKTLAALEWQTGGCECLYTTYKAMGNGAKALEYHELFTILQDSLNNEETGKKLQQMEFSKQVLADSLATVEKERLVEESHQEEVRKKNRTRNGLLIGGFFLILVAGGFYRRWRYVKKSRDIISKEKDRSENLLLNILPADIAEELKNKGKADARDFDTVSILFTDFKGFTEQSAKLTAAELVNEINHCFEAFDGIMEKYKIEKIKTIGDAYMAAGGLPTPTDDSVQNTVLAALKMQEFITKRKADMDKLGLPAFEMRVGIHTGPVVAGIVGVKKFQYDIWGDTVNTASRMESSGEVGKVNISQTTFDLLKSNIQFTFKHRGKIEVKGKGEMDMYFIERT